MATSVGLRPGSIGPAGRLSISSSPLRTGPGGSALVDALAKHNGGRHTLALSETYVDAPDLLECAEEGFLLLRFGDGPGAVGGTELGVEVTKMAKSADESVLDVLGDCSLNGQPGR